MKRLFLAAVTALIASTFASTAWGEGDNILDRAISPTSAHSWRASGLSQWPEEIADPAVQGGQALRFRINGRGANPWSVSADVSITKPVKAGDVILAAFWARAAEPAEGQQTAIIPAIRLQEVAAPYGAFAQDQATVTSQWTLYYVSGVADKDYKVGSIKLTLQLAAAKQVIDLGPVFVLDFGPNYDRSKLPHNRPVAAVAPAAQPVAPPRGPAPVTNAAAEQHFAAELARIRTGLPVPGALVNDPSVYSVGTYGNDQHREVVDVPDVPGGHAARVTIERAQATPYASGTASPLTGIIRKGDTVFIAFYARTIDADGPAGTISSIRVQLNQSPWSMAIENSVSVPKGRWQLFTFSGVAQADLPVGLGMLSAQIAGTRQVIEFGPAFVLNLGPGIAPASLPRN